MSVGFAALLWHLYLVLTAQTTIEFYGNATKTYRARAKGDGSVIPMTGLYKNWSRIRRWEYPYRRTRQRGYPGSVAA